MTMLQNCLTLASGNSALLFAVCVGAAMLVIGIGKAGFGVGVGIIAVPVMALALPVDQVIGLILPPLLIGDAVGMVGHRKQFDWKLLAGLLPGAIGGIVVASLILKLLQVQGSQMVGNVLNVLVGTVCLLIILAQGWRLLGKTTPNLRARGSMSLGIGAIEGFISTLTHSAGALVTVYMLKQNMAKANFVSTMLMLFLFINGLKMVFFVQQGLVTGQSVMKLAWYYPLIPLGAVLGFWLNKRVSAGPFTAVLYGVAGIAAVKMIVKVFV